MITVSLYKKNNNYYKLLIKGHANYAKHGNDIVCAAVSALSYSLYLGLNNVLNLSENIKAKQEDGFFNLILDKPDEKTEILFKTFVESIKSVEENYKKCIVILYKEEDDA